MREIFIIPELNNSFFHAKSAKGAKFLFLFVYHAGAGVVANFVTTRVRKAVIPFNFCLIRLYYLICDNPVQSVSSVGNIVIVIVFVFFLSHTESTEITEFPFIWLFVHAGAGIHGMALVSLCLPGGVFR